MNALGRTQPFQNSEREGGFTAGSPNLVTREERREANSQDAADYAEEEIRRLDAQLDAARLRFANLKQNLAVKTQEESKKFPPEISTEAPASAGALSDGTEAPKTPVSSNRDRAQNKDTTEVFILDEEAEEAAKQQQANAEQEQSRANNKRGATAQATLTPQTPTEEAAGAKPKRTAKPTLATTKGSGASKATPVDKSAKRTARGKEPSRSPSPYNGEAAVYKKGQKILYSDKDVRNKEARVAGANVPLDVCRPNSAFQNVKATPTHDDNVAELIKFWPHADAVHALAQTMTDEGEENIGRAFEFLMKQRDHRIMVAARKEKETAPGKGSREEEDEEETIREGGELAVILAGDPGAIMVVLHLLKVHKKMRNVHNSALERTAANLIANPQVQNYHDLKHVSNETLRRIAVSVIHDCRECEAARIKDAARLLEEKQKAKEAEERRVREAKAKEAEAENKRKVAEERSKRDREEAERRRQNRTPPLSNLDDDGLPLSHNDFEDKDAKWAKKRKAQICDACKRGDEGGEHVYVCDVCNRCYHKTCIRWTKIVRWNEDPHSELSNFSCPSCKKALPSKWILHASETESTPTRSGDGQANRASATPLIRTPGFTDRSAAAPAAGGGDVHLATLGSTLGSTGLTGTGGNGGVSFKIDKYFEWKAPPSDWDILKPHPECGMTKPAYQNWKALNVSRRDQAGGALGPLTNAIREDMMASVASVLIMNHPTIRAGRNETDFAAWLESDPHYKWVKTIPDVELLRCIDKHFCILDHEPFVAMKFGGPAQGYHATTEDGDTNYFASAFSAFADKWLNALKDLKTGGWDDKTRDLRQTFVDALESQPTLHREASTYRTTNHEILIAYMRGWCIQRETEVQKNAQTRAETAAARGAVKPPGNDKQMKEYERQVKALRTQIDNLKAQGGTGDRVVIARIPSHIDSKTEWYCHGCGKTYKKEKGKAIPCETRCVYSEHAEHNKEYKKGKAWPADKNPLSWGTVDTYKAKYKVDMPPTGKKYLELRAKYARKRERDNETSA
jgi:hypothetical protein